MSNNGIAINLPVIFSGSGLPSLSWTPSALGSSLAAWFSADKNVTLNGSQVSGWQDRTSAGISLVQATAGQQPNFISSAQNLLPGVQNSLNTSAPMVLSSAAVVSALAFDRATPFTVAIALKRGTVGTHQDILGHSDTIERGWVLGDGTSTLVPTAAGTGAIGLSLYSSGSALIAAHGSTVLAAGSSYIAIAQYDGSGTAAGITAILNKIAETMTQTGTTPGTGNFQNGSGRMFMFGSNPASANFVSQDTILEVLIVNRVLTSTEQTLVDSYLNGRWAIHA